jgi:hypothetical protein
MVQFGDSRADAALATEAAVAAQLDNVLGRGGRFEVFYPDPGRWVDYVAAGSGRDAEVVIETLQGAAAADTMAAAGLRPTLVSSAPLPEGLGQPGQRLETGIDEAALIEAWAGLP